MPPLLFKKPSKKAKRLKALLYGQSGVGKTTAAIAFPRPALIDTERGAVMDQYVEALEQSGGVVLSTSNFETVLDQVRSLAIEKHPYQTLIIDPITVIYDDLSASWEKKVGDEWSRHRQKATTDWKRLTTLLSTLDMNVVLTAHAKNEWANGEATGRQTWDGPKGADYWVDLNLEVQRRDGDDRVAIVRKSRVRGLEVDTELAFSYEAIAEPYGRDVLERDATPLAPNYMELLDLVSSREDGEDLLSRMLKKAGVATISDLSSEQVGKAIEWLNA